VSEKCTKRSAPIVAMNAKFHSNPIPTGRCTVEIVGRREEKEEVSDIGFFIGSFIMYFVVYYPISEAYKTLSPL